VGHGGMAGSRHRRLDLRGLQDCAGHTGVSQGSSGREEHTLHAGRSGLFHAEFQNVELVASTELEPEDVDEPEEVEELVDQPEEVDEPEEVDKLVNDPEEVNKLVEEPEEVDKSAEV